MPSPTCTGYPSLLSIAEIKTITKSNVWGKGFIWLICPCHGPPLREVTRGAQVELENKSESKDHDCLLACPYSLLNLQPMTTSQVGGAFFLMKHLLSSSVRICCKVKCAESQMSSWDLAPKGSPLTLGLANVPKPGKITGGGAGEGRVRQVPTLKQFSGGGHEA